MHIYCLFRMILIRKSLFFIFIFAFYSFCAFAQPSQNFFQALFASIEDSPMKEWVKYERTDVKPCQHKELVETSMIKALHSYGTEFKKEEEWPLWFDFFCKKKYTTALMIALGEAYFPYIDSILKANGLPAVFRYLPVALSAMNSKSGWGGGAGLWHLYIPYLSKSRLKVSPEYDERLNAEKSAEIAIRQLKLLYDKNKSVKNTLTAYTFGPFSKADRQGEYSKEDFLSAFTAVVYLFENKKLFNYSNINFQYPETTAFLLNDSIQLSLKEKYPFNAQVISILNPEHTSGYYNAGEAIKILKQDEENFKQWLENRKQPVVETEKTLYKVKSGDTLTAIASNYGVEIKEIMEWNSLNSSRIFPGQELIILKKQY